jgi:hypothetical protein
VAAGPHRLRGDAGQHTPDAHGGLLLPSHSWVYGYTNAKTAKGNPVVHCPAGERKYELAKEYLTKTNITQGVFLILAGRAQAPMWDVSANHLVVNIFQKS